MTVLRRTPVITAMVLKGLDTLRLPFNSEANMSDPYVIKQVDGLDPPDQQVAIARTASGGKYQGKSSESREIVVLISLNNGDPKQLRNNLYTMLNTGYNPFVRIKLYSGSSAIASTTAYVTRFEAVLWTKDPVVQITFTCLNPTFQAMGMTRYSHTDLSEISPNIFNKGTAEVGFQFAVKFTDNMEHWFIKQTENQKIGMMFDKSFEPNDTLEVSTIPGNRYVHWKSQGGAVKNKLGILNEDSEWLMLHPGPNHFVVSPKTSNWEWKGMLSFQPRYWGV